MMMNHLTSYISVRTYSGPGVHSDVAFGAYFFFFGRTFDLVSGQQYICACAVPHPLCTYTFEKGVLNMITLMIEQNDCQEDCS